MSKALDDVEQTIKIFSEDSSDDQTFNAGILSGFVVLILERLDKINEVVADISDIIEEDRDELIAAAIEADKQEASREDGT